MRIAAGRCGMSLPSFEDKMRVLVVEDEMKLAVLVCKALREHGISADVPATGEDALWMTAATNYDVIIFLDVNYRDRWVRGCPAAARDGGTVGLEIDAKDQVARATPERLLA
jgi:CheY-like chemotaxis protein